MRVYIKYMPKKDDTRNIIIYAFMLQTETTSEKF